MWWLICLPAACMPSPLGDTVHKDKALPCLGIVPCIYALEVETFPIIWVIYTLDCHPRDGLHVYLLARSVIWGFNCISSVLHIQEFHLFRRLIKWTRKHHPTEDNSHFPQRFSAYSMHYIARVSNEQLQHQFHATQHIAWVTRDFEQKKQQFWILACNSEGSHGMEWSPCTLKVHAFVHKTWSDTSMHL